MKEKKIFLTIIIISFVSALAVAFFLLFSISKINITFTISENTDVSEVKEIAEKYKGKNLLFVDVEDIKKDLGVLDYFETLSVQKNFPNKIDISVKERREVFALNPIDSNSVYVISEEGYVFSIVEKEIYNQNKNDKLIDFTIEGISALTTEKSQLISTDNDLFFFTVLNMAKKVDLTDCINDISVCVAVEKHDVIFNTITGVKLIVYDADDQGVEKIEKQFDKYENLDDYLKTYGYILVDKLIETGEIRATWSDKIN